MTGLQDESVPWPEISRYALRAQALVQGRNPSAVNWGGIVVDWAMTEVLPEIEDRHPELIPKRPNEPESRLRILTLVREAIAIRDLPEFPDATWPELLACYGIRQIGRAHVSLQRKRDLVAAGIKSHPTLAVDLDGQFLSNLLEAVESIQIAQQLVDVQAEAKAEATLLFSAQQSEKAIRRHAATRELQDRFEDFFLQRGTSNKVAAAKDFLAGLDPDDRRILTRDEDNAVRTLTRGLLRRHRDSANDD